MKENKLLYNSAKCIYSILLKIIYNPKVIGKENILKKGAFIIAGNHIHAYDPILVMAQTKRLIHYFAKIEIFKGLQGKFYEQIGLIKVDREKKGSTAMLQGVKCLNNGGVIGIFPEGTRNRTNKDLLKFKKGAVIMAKQTNTPIIPFAIQGKFRPFRKGLKIIIGKPIYINNMEIEEANIYLKDEILRLLKNNEEPII